MMQNVNMRMGLQSWQIDRYINFDRDQENESLLIGLLLCRDVMDQPAMVKSPGLNHKRHPATQQNCL